VQGLQDEKVQVKQLSTEKNIFEAVKIS